MNIWPCGGRAPYRDELFISSYAYWADDPTVKSDWLSPGYKAPSAEPAYAPIAGRPFPRRIITRFPPEPKDGRLHPRLYREASTGLWAPSRAFCHPLVPSAPLVSVCSSLAGRGKALMNALIAPLEFPRLKHDHRPT